MTDASIGRRSTGITEDVQQASSDKTAIPNQWRCRMAEFPPPPEGIVLAHFIVSDDVERSRRFYTEVLGGRVA
jgi:hypothetical protein